MWISPDVQPHVLAKGVVMWFRPMSNRESARLAGVNAKRINLARAAQESDEDSASISLAAREATVVFLCENDGPILRIEGGPGGKTLTGQALSHALMNQISEQTFTDLFDVVRGASEPTPPEGKESGSPSSPQDSSKKEDNLEAPTHGTVASVSENDSTATSGTAS